MIAELSESRIATGRVAFERIEAHDLADMLYLYLLSLRICLIEDNEWARRYLDRTTMWNDYDRWRSNGNDLYVLLHGIHKVRDDVVFPLDRKNLHRWFMQARRGHEAEPMTRKIFVRLDHDLRIKDAGLRALRRLVLDWPTLTETNRKITMTRLLQLVRRKLRRSEILPRLEKITKRADLEIEDAVDPDDPIKENATAGATGAANVAGVVGALGAGFDPDVLYRSIYGGDKKKKTGPKPIVLRR